MSLPARTPNPPVQPVAVVGMGCRLPGDVDSPAALWRLLMRGQDAVGPPPAERQALWESRPGAHPMPEHAGYLRDVSGFDADFFGVSGREAAVLDPQHRLLLEVTWEALEHAGIPPDRLGGTSTAVFTGLSYTDYMDHLDGRPQDLEGAILTNGHCVAPGRISYLLGLQGPSVAVDTACSSSLVALHLACQSLRAGECDLALAGGVSLILRSRTTRSFARMGMLSPSGRCRTFDAGADGFVRGEGCAVVAVKRLDDALRDRDRVLAVVHGSAVNQDGRSEGLAAPSAPAQRAVYEAALRQAGVRAEDVGLIETHGTGTALGDPTEFSGLAQVYGRGDHRCALGSVKTNLGHLEPAAGATGLVKAVLCLQHGVIPANLHFSGWNPAIDPGTTRFFVPTRSGPWPVPSGTRTAAVSSFGFSGTNAHVLLGQAPALTGTVPAQRHAGPDRPKVFVVPAGSAAALPAAARRLADWVAGPGATTPLYDIAHTLAVRRSSGRGRLGVTASSRQELETQLRAVAEGRIPPEAAVGEVGGATARRPVWVFSGQGSQWTGMGRRMLEDPAFATALAEVDEAIRAESGICVLQIVRDGEEVSGCGLVQPVLFALQVALAATWRAYGIEPAGVIGHSMGEVAAAVVAGALSLADGARVICRRSRLLAGIAGSGAMATVACDRRTVEAELAADGGQVSVAVVAAPQSTVVSGPADRVRELVDRWHERGVPAALIAVDVASHSPQVEPLLDELRHQLAGLQPVPPDVRFYSTVLDDPRQSPAFDADYWCANLRRPVQFTSAVAAAAADRHLVYVEVAPHPVVTQSVIRALAGAVEGAVVVPTLLRDEDDLAVFRRHLAVQHCAGVGVDWSAVYPARSLADLPTVAFDRRRHWADPDDTASTRGQDLAASPGMLPGPHTRLPGEPARHHWQARAGTAALPWLQDHRVGGRPVMPGAMYYAMALTCACEVFDAPATQVEVTDLRFESLLALDEHTELSTVVTATGPERAECEIYGRTADGAWDRQATALLARSGVPAQRRATTVETLVSRHMVPLEPASLYEALRARGLEHGPAFTGVEELSATRNARSFWGRIALPASVRDLGHGLHAHPVLVDLCAQMAVAPVVRQPGTGLVLPVEMKAVRVLGDTSTAVYCHARITESTPDSLVGQVRLLDASGQALLAVDGLRFARHEAGGQVDVDQWFLETEWERTPAQPPSGRAGGDWLVIGEADGCAAVLGDGLASTGVAGDVWDHPLDDTPAEQFRQLVADRLTAREAARHSPLRGVVVLCGAPGACGDDPTADALRRTRRLLGAAQALAAADGGGGVGGAAARLYVVTRAARAITVQERTDPGQAALRGLVRVLAFEHPGLRTTLVDTALSDAWLHDVIGELLADSGDDEVAVRAGVRHRARLSYAPLSVQERAAASTSSVRFAVDGCRLRVGTLGDMGSLELTTRTRTPPAAGEVEVHIQAAGVNFRDVLTTMGLLPSEGEDVRYRIGFECAGTVTAVGGDVRNTRVGDHVVAVDLRGGAFGTFVTVPEEMTAPVPKDMDCTAAAGIPIAFATAWYALHDVARLGAGERVLIHSATGGTGQAAVAVARLLGAEVLATAGTEDKRRLLRGMGIATVMDSRSLDFGEQARRATGGEGVDVVLNSLSGPAVRVGLEALRPFGRFVELGVRDILSNAPLGMAPLRHNVTFSTVDLIELQRARPQRFAALLRKVLAEFSAGSLKPLYCTTFPLAQAGDALRLMARAGHHGKIVLTVPAMGRSQAQLPDGPTPVQRGGAYIVTGGLRGLGLATACWLAEQGAGHLVLNGRSGPSAQVTQQLNDLSSRGVRVSVVLGDIAEPGTAERLTGAVSAHGMPLRGVVHCAMALEDAAIVNVRDEQLDRVWAPKVVGAWRLHQATEQYPLDWFVMYSSMASLLGNPGQGAYAAANAWLDGFAAWRTEGGQPTLAVNWGPWGETGVATGFAERGYRTIPTRAGLEALHDLLAYRRVQTGVVPGSPHTFIPQSGRDSSFFGLLVSPQENSAVPGQGREDIRSRLRSIEAGLARQSALESYLAEHIRSVLRLETRTLDSRTPLSALGFDSLLSMELRNRIESALEVRLPGEFLWKNATVEELADALAERMDLDPAPVPGGLRVD
jgi:polyketide synthase 2/polyketide synthase 5